MFIALKKIRQQKGIEVPELAEKTGLSKTMIWGYESGRRNPTPDALCALADALDVSLDMLVRGKEKDHSEEWSKENIIKRLEAYDLADLQEMVILSSFLQFRKEREQSQGQESADTQ